MASHEPPLSPELPVHIITIFIIIIILTSSVYYRIELNEDEMKAGLFAYERWSRGALSTFLDTKRDGTNVEQERINDNYL